MKTKTNKAVKETAAAEPKGKAPKKSREKEKAAQKKALREQIRRENKIVALLRERGTISIEEISDSIDLDKQMVFKLLDSLKSRRPELQIICAGDRVILPRSGEILEPTDVEIKNGGTVFRNTITLGILSSLNLGSIAQQMDTLYHIWEEVLSDYGIDTVFVNGNFVMDPMLKLGQNETFLMKLRTPIEDKRLRTAGSKTRLDKTIQLWRRLVPYVAKFFPRQTNGRLVKTHIIGGLNEAEWAKVGLSIIPHIVNKRMEVLGVGPEKNDLLYKGDFFRIFRIRNAGEAVPIVILNSKRKPFRGIYSRSHRPQRTSVTVSTWFMEKLKRAGFEGMPHLVLWTDGRGIYTYKATAAGSHFVSLPSLCIGDPADFDVDTVPNFGMAVVKLCFDKEGRLIENGTRARRVDLTNYITQRGW